MKKFLSAFFLLAILIGGCGWWQEPYEESYSYTPDPYDPYDYECYVDTYCPYGGYDIYCQTWGSDCYAEYDDNDYVYCEGYNGSGEWVEQWNYCD